MDTEGLSQRMDATSAGRDGSVNEAVDPFATEAPIVSEAEKRGLTREQAIAFGRRLAEDENRKLDARNHLFDPQGRIARAERYAAWEYDGRLAGTIGRRRD